MDWQIWLLFLLCSLPLGAKAQTLSFEKEGRLLLPGQRFGLSSGHRIAYEGPQPFDMLSYSLDLNLAMTTDALGGTTMMTMRLKQNVDSLVLNAVGLALDTVTVDGVLKASRIDSLTETFSIDLDGTRNAGDTLRIFIAYRRLQNYHRPSSRQGYYFFRDTLGLPSNLGYTFTEPSDSRFWMPCYDEPWDKATAEVHLTVPAGYVAASNGRLLGTSNNGNGTVTWRWKEVHQIATYLMCLTVSKFSVASVPFVKSSGDTIPVQYYSWNAAPFVDSAWTAAYLPVVRDMIAGFSHLFGEYPFDKYGMTTIVPFGYLGEEHQTLTTLNRYYATSQRTVSHELAHQWWGDDVTCGTWPDIWLNESFATYSEALWREYSGGPDSMKHYMQDTLAGFQYGSWQGAIYDPVGQGFNLFDQVVYTKGAWVLHTLRGVVGDSAFFRSLRAYRDTYRGQSAITQEFKSVVDSVAGTDMSWFFNQWIYGKGWPKYSSRFTWSADTISLTIQQHQEASWPTYRMPIVVRAYYGGHQQDYVVQDSLRVQMFRLPLTAQPDSVVMDPDGWILKQIVAPASVPDGEGVALAFHLDQNYPNPFNPATTIRFTIGGVAALSGALSSGVEGPLASHVKLTVYDILGREVATLVNEQKSPGEYSVAFDASRLSSGVYYYRMQAGNFARTKHMLLVK